MSSRGLSRVAAAGSPLKSALLFCATLVVLPALLAWGGVVRGDSACGVVPIPINGTSIDLSVASALSFSGYLQQNSPDGSAPEGRYAWHINPCERLFCSGTAFAEQSGCQVTFGQMAKAPTFITDHIKILYSSTSSSFNWVASMFLYCGTGSGVSVVGNTYNAYQKGADITLDFSFSSSAFCYKPPSSPSEFDGITWGAVFLVFFFVPLALYFFGFLCWNCYQGQRGCAMCPHTEFWGSLPGLFKDGVTFTWAKIRGQEWHSSYSEEDDGGSSARVSGATKASYNEI